MKKLKLELDALQVESFDSAAEPRGEGTVNGHEDLLGSISYCSPCFFTQQPNCTSLDC